MKPLTSKEQILRYLRNNPGEKFTIAEITAHFMASESRIRELMKQMVNDLQIESTTGGTRSRNVYKDVQYYAKALDIVEPAYAPVKPLQMTLAKRIALERCQEMYPADRHHFECVSKIPGNPSLKGDE